MTTGEVIALIKAFSGSGGGSSGGGVLVVHMVYDEEKDNEYTDKTWKEIYDAPMAVFVNEDSDSGGFTAKQIYPVAAVIHFGSEYIVGYHYYSINQSEVTIEMVKLVTDSENGYLTWAE